MDNNSNGRQKNVTGTGKGLKKRGQGLGTGPVGREDGYAGRKQQQGSPRPGGSSVSQASHSVESGGGSSAVRAVTRAGKVGILPLLLVGLVLFFVLKGCNPGTAQPQQQTSLGGMSGLLSLMGGGSSGGGSSASSSSGLDLSSLLGGFSGGGGNVSTGWAREANVGRLNESVASGARAKRTTIKGNNQDTFTIMVYMCGTDLESKYGMATNDLNEMMRATYGSNVRVIVCTGGCKQWKTSSISNRVNQIYEIAGGKMTCLKSDFGSDSLVKPATLTKFIKYCLQNYPANRRALIFWDHGGGSISGYGYDEKNASLGSMSLSGINTALKDAGTTFDFIGFDACLMATLETGLMLDNYADYMIASEETEPGIGWYYTNWLTALGNNSSLPTIQIGKQIVDDFVAQCNISCAGQKTTLSVVDLAELSATVPSALSTFSNSTSKQLSGTDYKTVSDARSATREFAASNRIDQIDLVHLCYNLDTPESNALAKALCGAVKYNKTSSSISNAYGISIYFPYQRTNRVSSAVSTYKAIGMDSAYSRCIQQFANLETGGQAASNAASSPLSSLGGTATGGNSSDDIIGSLLGSLLSGGRFVDNEINVETAAEAIAANQFDGTKLVWTKTSGGQYVMSLPAEQWALVHSLALNVFYDDGEGYIDLGIDPMYSFTDKGELVGDYDGTWIAIDNQEVPFYYESVEIYDGVMYTTGRVPVLLNGERAELILVFENDAKTGEYKDSYIEGAQSVYKNGETDTVAKAAVELNEGDKFVVIADYYTYAGDYQDTYEVTDPITYKKGMTVSYVYVNGAEDLVATMVFTDIYNQEYWSLPMNNLPVPQG